MLVTIYQVTYPGLLPVQQYYRWPFPQDAEGRTLAVDRCPGCGRNLGYLADRHKCRGTLTANPIDNRMHSRKTGRPPRRPQDDKRRQDALLRQYLATLDHPVTVSE